MEKKKSTCTLKIANNSIKGSLEEKIGQWNLVSKLIEAPVQVAKRFNVRFIFLYWYYFSKASFFKIVYYSVGSFKPRDIRFLLSMTFVIKYFHLVYNFHSNE